PGPHRRTHRTHPAVAGAPDRRRARMRGAARRHGADRTGPAHRSGTGARGMKLTDMTPGELHAQRLHLMNSLRRLKRASTTWNAATTARGEATMANLMQQVY